jgi:hypothetical protein
MSLHVQRQISECSLKRITTKLAESKDNTAVLRSLSLALHGEDPCSISGHSIGICGSQTSTWTGLFRVLQFPLPLSFYRCSLFIKSSISDAKN